MDSQAALKAFNSNFVGSSLVLLTIHTLAGLAAANNVFTLRWVKAHVGHAVNEAADV